MSFLYRLRKLSLSKDRKAKCVWIGLDNAGKTTLMQRVISGIFEGKIPRTLGLNVEKIRIESDKNLELVCWDLGGQFYFRSSLWSSYMNNADAIIFVIDSTNTARFIEAKNEFKRYILENQILNNVPVLILANKQDLPDSVTSEQIIKELEIDKIKRKSTLVISVSAVTGHNLMKALDWLANQILE